MKMGLMFPPFKSGPHSNSGLQGPTFHPLNITSYPLRSMRDTFFFFFDEAYKEVVRKMQVTGKISCNK